MRIAEEARFNASFGDVRVHDSRPAHALAQQYLARAFTVGTEIVFNQGRYQPGSQEGRRLLAHELAHVVQQSRGSGASLAGTAHEAAADAAAAAVVSGRERVHAGPGAAEAVQCEALSPEEITRLSLPLLQARISENEREASVEVLSEEYRSRLAAEHVRLQRRHAELSGARRSETGEAAGPETATVVAQVNAELAEVEPLVAKLIVDVPANPKDHALRTVRGVATRLETDQRFVTDLASRGGAPTSDLAAAASRLQALQSKYAPVVKSAEQWHTDNPAGESLEMMHERHGTWLAGKGVKYTDKGGWYYVIGVGAFVVATGVAALDASERLLSLGFHEAATAVSTAYERGDISWNEGEEILYSAAWRALLVAAVTGGAGAVTSRLGASAARGLGLAPEALSFGAVKGGVTGGLSSASGLAAQAGMTIALQDQFKSSTAAAIWSAGLPQGKDWVVAIPLNVLLGGLGGARAVRLGNEQLVGSVVDTPGGRAKIVAITKTGQVVLEPVGMKAAAPSPPPSDLVMVYDAASGSWKVPQTTGTELATTSKMPTTESPGISAGAGPRQAQPTAGLSTSAGGRPAVSTPRGRGYTAEGAGDRFTHGPLPETPDAPVSAGRSSFRNEGEALSSYAGALKSTERQNPATAAARGESGPYIRDNLYGKTAQGRVVKNLQDQGILRVAPESEAVTIVDPDRYVAWLERSYSQHGGTRLDPRMGDAIRRYVSQGGPIASGGDNPAGGKSFAGSLPGTHAELLAVNDVLARGGRATPLDVATVRSSTGEHFAACLHCAGVLKQLPDDLRARVWTGEATKAR